MIHWEAQGKRVHKAELLEAAARWRVADYDTLIEWAERVKPRDLTDDSARVRSPGRHARRHHRGHRGGHRRRPAWPRRWRPAHDAAKRWATPSHRLGCGRAARAARTLPSHAIAAPRATFRQGRPSRHPAPTSAKGSPCPDPICSPCPGTLRQTAPSAPALSASVRGVETGPAWAADAGVPLRPHSAHARTRSPWRNGRFGLYSRHYGESSTTGIASVPGAGVQAACLSAGRHAPAGGVNFSLYSAHATQWSCCCSIDRDAQPAMVIALTRPATAPTTTACLGARHRPRTGLWLSRPRAQRPQTRPAFRRGQGAARSLRRGVTYGEQWSRAAAMAPATTSPVP